MNNNELSYDEISELLADQTHVLLIIDRDNYSEPFQFIKFFENPLTVQEVISELSNINKKFINSDVEVMDLSYVGDYMDIIVDFIQKHPDILPSQS